jgi:uncharacterized membrane protein YebE (DUF533 family)
LRITETNNRIIFDRSVFIMSLNNILNQFMGSSAAPSGQDPDHPAERAHLDNLAMALQLPAELSQQLEQQAHQAMSEAT